MAKRIYENIWQNRSKYLLLRLEIIQFVNYKTIIMEVTAKRKANFTPAQIEVLNAVAHLRTEEEIIGLRQAISNYFFDLVDKEMDKLWESGEWNEQTLEELKHSHYRTPYKSEQ